MMSEVSIKTKGNNRQPDLRQKILAALYQHRSLTLPGLAAVCLVLPDEARSTVVQMMREGLLSIETVRGWDVIRLTEIGREVAKKQIASRR